MKRLFFLKPVKLFVLFTIVFFNTVACNILKDEQEGRLNICFSLNSYSDTKAISEMPDTSEFLLDIKGSDGNVVYKGKFADSPEHIMVKPGSYIISVRSTDSTKPCFSKPIYGDEQCVVVPSGGVGRAVMCCRLINCGIRLRIAPDFLTSYPEGVLYLKSKDGSLMYGYSEKRIAYFNPGEISFVLYNTGEEKTLFKRIMKSRDMLDMGISAPNSSISEWKRDIEISIDTSGNWISDHFIIGGSNKKGDTKESAYTVSEAKTCLGAKGKWVCGFIVGSFKSPNNLIIEPPFYSSTNIAIAGRRKISDKKSCLSVELKKGKMREALNLQSFPSNLGRKIYIKGDIVESYYGIPGIKNVSEYEFK